MREEIGIQEPTQPCSNLSDEVCQEKMWRPSRVESLREYEINIKFLSIGCIITVGCKSIPFSNISEGMEALNNYVSDPYESKKLWEERINKQQ
tara:strand:+ start:447 stop:725 length:279 start_codon:yes stop_codon:yes gene_type:complete